MNSFFNSDGLRDDHRNNADCALKCNIKKKVKQLSWMVNMWNFYIETDFQSRAITLEDNASRRKYVILEGIPL